MAEEDRLAELEQRMAKLEQGPAQSVARAQNIWGFKNPLLHPTGGVARRTRSLWIPASEFVISSGVPILSAGFSANYMGWNLDDTADEAVLSQTAVPMDFYYTNHSQLHTRNRQGVFEIKSGLIEIGIYYVVPTTNTGTIIFQIGARLTNDNKQTFSGSTKDMSAAMSLSSGNYSATIFSNSQHELARLPLAVGGGVTADTPKPNAYGDHPGIGPEILTIKIARIGSNPSDTLAGDIVVIGALAYYVAEY